MKNKAPSHNHQPSRPEVLTAEEWFAQQGWEVFDFQRQCWDAVADGRSGLLQAPTGSGKTYALFLSLHSDAYRASHADIGSGKLKVLWITPLRALSADIALAIDQACKGMGVEWDVGVRTSDTPQALKTRQLRTMPEVLVITPESLHVLFSYPDAERLFSDLSLVVVDEWHELLGSKRGVQTELAIAHLRSIQPAVCIWGISATIGNIDEAVDVLHGSEARKAIRVTSRRRTPAPHFSTLMPAEIEKHPWTGHVGLHMLEQAEAVIRENTSTLVFTNTRSQAEVWYQNFLTAYPEYAGIMALHHGSIQRDVREWVELNIKNGRLKVVFCTSSLDLGVDFPTVDAIIQIGSPKGVARFLQRAGRSGHRPDARSKAWFLPTHSLEIIEGAALRTAMKTGLLESRQPHRTPIDVLVQWVVTLACGSGFSAESLLAEVRSTHAYAQLTDEEWQWVLLFVTRGGTSLTAYPEYHKVVEHDGKYSVSTRTIASRHRMQIGTIASDSSLSVALMNGKSLGTIEEGFISRLAVGDVFLIAGRTLELVRIEDATVFVRPSLSTKGAIARWDGGRMPLSAQMSDVLRSTLHDAACGRYETPELKKLKPLLDLQAEQSIIPQEHQILVEQFVSSEGYHAFLYPFEGRLAHEGLATVLAYRLSQGRSITFSMAMNDYAIELMSDQPWFIDAATWHEVCSIDGLEADIHRSANASELSRRRFREIARIAGLVFQGFPGRQKKTRHLQASARMFYDVFRDYDPGNLLYRQAHEETLQFQLDLQRMRSALERIQQQDIVIRTIDAPTPLCAPVLVDRLREQLGTERAADKIARLVAKSTRTKSASSKSTQSKPVQSKPVQSKPAQSKPTGKKTASNKSTKSKSTTSKSGDNNSVTS